jgi:tetratricopeptide (TPR) repeat protein
VVRDKCVASGNKYFQSGKFKEASILYRRALQLDPKYGEAYYRLGLVDLELQQYDEALNSLRRACDLDDSNEDAAVRLAGIYLSAYIGNREANKWALAEATTVIERILKKNPRSYQGLQLDADLALAANDPNTAIQKLREANEVRPGQPDTITALMQNLVGVGKQNEAEQVGREFIAHHKTYGPVYDLLYMQYLRGSQFSQAEEILKTKIANLPADGFSRIELAAFYYVRNRKQEMLGILDTLRADRKTFPEVDGLIGDLYLRAGDFDTAIQCYRDGQKNQPKLNSAYEKRIVETLLVAGRREEAMRVVDRLHKENPNDLEAAGLRAVLLSRGNPAQVQTAIGELEALIAREPGSALLHFSLARAYQSKGDRDSLDKARQHLKTSIVLNRNSLAARQTLADVEMARGQYRETVQIAEEILRMSPLNLLAKLTRAAGLTKLGELEKAHDELSGILRSGQDSNQARFLLAWVDLAARRYAEAETGFLALIRAGDAQGVIGLARCKDAQGRSSEAMQLLEHELAKSPDNDDSRMALADIEYRAGRFQDARMQWERLAAKNPNSAEFQLRLGEVLNRMGDKQGALPRFRKAHELQPSNLGAAAGLALVLHQTGQTDQARAVYEDVLKLDPENVQAMNNLAYLKAEEGLDLDQALGLAQRAMQRAPNDPNISDTLGLIYIRKKLTVQAVHLFQDLVARAPDNPAYHLHLAMALYDTGQKELAKKELELAQRHKPSAAEQAKIKELAGRIG